MKWQNQVLTEHLLHNVGLWSPGNGKRGDWSQRVQERAGTRVWALSVTSLMSELLIDFPVNLNICMQRGIASGGNTSRWVDLERVLFQLSSTCSFHLLISFLSSYLILVLFISFIHLITLVRASYKISSNNCDKVTDIIMMLPFMMLNRIFAVGLW